MEIRTAVEKQSRQFELKKLAREGAGLSNYIWIDSQDIAGVEKELLRAAAVWLMGVQREANEVQRSLSSIPKGIKRPTAADIVRLGLGEFYACWGEHVHKVYVQPAWLDSATAQKIARGMLNVQGIERPTPEDDMSDWKQIYEEERSRRETLEGELQKLRAQLAQLNSNRKSDRDEPRAHSDEWTTDGERLYQAFKRRLLQEKDPGIVALLSHRPELHVKIDRPVLELDESTLRGRLARLIVDGFFDDAKTGNAAFVELKRRGVSTAKPNVYRELDKLAEMGFVTKESEGYQKTPDAVIKSAIRAKAS